MSGRQFALDRKQQEFLCDIFETKDVYFAVEKLQIMMSEAGCRDPDLVYYINRLISKYDEEKRKLK